MLFNHAYLEELGSGKLRIEETLVRSELQRRGIGYSLYTKKRIQRRQLPLSHSDFIMGDMDSMHGAMHQLGIEIPVVDDYPLVLQEYMHRKTWRSTVGELIIRLDDDQSPPFFAKPAGRRKVFTGRVFAGPHDAGHLQRISRTEAVMCSEIVRWTTEYRAFVIGSDLMALDHYSGDSTVELDISAVRRAVASFAGQKGAIAACGLDFGVLDTGKTALVEANDGFALGAYNVAAEPYTEVLLARWAQLVAQHSE